MQIAITPRTLPVCQCGQTENWTVAQRITRNSKLVRVDGLGDLLVEMPDAITHQQTIALICGTCATSYVPQPGVEAWYEGGGEDGFGWQSRNGHDGEDE